MNAHTIQAHHALSVPEHTARLSSCVPWRTVGTEKNHTLPPLVLIQSDIGNWPQPLGPHRNFTFDAISSCLAVKADTLDCALPHHRRMSELGWRERMRGGEGEDPWTMDCLCHHLSPTPCSTCVWSLHSIRLTG